MDQQVQQQVDQKLRSQWQQVYPQILETFTTVSRADLDSAHNADDLVRRIADKSHYSERFVETRISELVGVSTGGQPSQALQQQPFARSAQGQQGQISQGQISQQG